MQLVLTPAEHADTTIPSLDPADTPARPAAVRRARGPAAARRAAPGATGRPPAARPPATAASQVHACHGRARQVEVLRDAILHLLADDPTLEPRDVIVMCPDIETFAPLIQATFGAGEVAAEDEDDAAARGRTRPDLRVRLADRSLRQTNPRARRRRRAARARPTERVTASAGARLRRPRAGAPPLRPRRRRPRPARGVGRRRAASAGASTPRTARRSSSTRSTASTWRAGLDRVLLGVAMTEEDHRLFEASSRSTTSTAARSTSPAASPSSSTGSQRGARRARRGRSRSTAGPTALADAADALTATRAARRLAARASSTALLDDVVAEARVAGAERATELSLAEVRALLAERLAGPPDARELPHRPPDGLHARADALGPAPGRLPARARRRRLPAPAPARRRRPHARATRTSATATRAPRTASCCSTRCWRRPTA